MIDDTYRVRLDAFEGPLDLLLYLIRKDEVDLHDIPIASITEQYLAYIAQIQHDCRRVDIDTAGEFLVMAATLMEIKSRMLMPQPEVAAAHATGERKGEKADPREELVRQLLEYKRYRDAANALEARAEEWRRRFPAGHAKLDSEALSAAIEAAPDVEMEDLDLLDLVEAFRRIADTVNFDRLGEHQVTYDDTPLELHAEDIVLRIREEGGETGELTLQSMFGGRSRGEMVGLFLALLQLVKSRRVRVRQDRAEGLILVRLGEEDGEASSEDDDARAGAATETASETAKGQEAGQA
jgi:segregation and condensation protein A